MGIDGYGCGLPKKTPGRPVIIPNLTLVIIIFICNIRENFKVSIAISIIIVLEVLHIWHIIITILKTMVYFAHSSIEWFDEGLARELNGMIEASDVVSFVKGVLKFVEGSCLNII
jgi:hypothetical protein